MQLTQDLVPRYLKCRNCGKLFDLIEEEVSLLIPYLKREEIAEPVDKVVEGYCENCNDPNPGKVIADCSTLQVTD